MKKEETLSIDQIKARFSDTSVEDLKLAFEELQVLDKRHRSSSRSRRWAERLSHDVSRLLKPGGFLDVVQTLAGASQVAALTVGGLKAILMFVSSRGSSYTLLSERTEQLVSLFLSVAVYEDIEHVTPAIEQCLEEISRLLGSFYQLAHSTYEKRSGRLRVLGFLFKSYADVFDEINQKIERALNRLQDLAVAQTYCNTSEIKFENNKDRIEECIGSLQTTNVDDVWNRCYQKRVNGTCDWIFRDKTAIRNWYHDPSPQFLLITGGTGCGKTTVAACIVKELQRDTSTNGSDTDPSTLVCSYTTVRDRSTRDNATTTTQTFLFQAFVQRERLTRLAMATSRLHGGCHKLSLSQLWNITLTVIDNVQPGRVYIVIDGIDNFDLDPMNDLMLHLNSLQKQPNVKLLVTSSDSNLYKFKLPECTEQFDISPKTREDLGLVVSAALACLPESELSREEEQLLTKTIVDKAGSCTLWANMILDTILSSTRRNSTQLQDLIAQTPRNLEKLYLECLSRISPLDRADAARMLHILFGAGSLTVEGLKHAFVSDRIYETPEALKTACEQVSSSPVRLKGLLGVLIHIEEDRIKLAHSSVGEYFLKLAAATKEDTEDDLPLPPSYIKRAFGCSTERNVTLMAAISVNYLRTCDLCGLVDDDTNIPVEQWEFASMCMDRDEPATATETPASTKSPIAGAKPPAALFDWAAANWAKFVWQLGVLPSPLDHVMMTEEMLENIIALSDKRSGASCRWAKYYVEGEIVQSPDQRTFHLADISPLVVAARFDMEPVLKYVLRKYHADLSISDYMNALMFASSNWVAHCLPLLLDHMRTTPVVSGSCTEADLEACLHAALFAAAEAGIEGNVSIILKATPDIDVSRLFARDHSPLSITIAHNHVATAKRLLGAPALDRAKVQDMILAVEFTPTAPGFERLELDDLNKVRDKHYSYICDSLDKELDILRVLLEDDRIDVSARDKRGRSLLSYAAERGRCDVVDLLITLSDPSRSTQAKSLLDDEGDDEGKTPMWYASWNNHIPILRRLCEAGDMTAQVTTRNIQDGETAFSAAARRGYSSVIRFLASKWPVGLGTRDNCNRTLLSTTALADDTQGAATARVLLNLGAADTIELESDTGRTALEYAVNSSRFKLMKVLVLAGADTDRILTKDAQGEQCLVNMPAAEWTAGDVQDDMIRFVQLRRDLVKRGTSTLHGVAELILKRSAFARAFAP